MKHVKYLILLFLLIGFFSETSAGVFKSRERKSHMPEQLQAQLDRVNAINAANDGKVWKPGHQIMKMYLDDEWVTAADETYIYDEETGLLKETTGLGERTKYTYNSDGYPTKILTEILEEGEWVTKKYITKKYDDILKDFVIETL